MANTFITPTVVARRALATLYNTIVLAQLVYRDYDQDFTGKQGDTVNVRKPATFDAKVFSRSSGIDLQEATESSIPVQLDTLLDVSFPITAEELTLELDQIDERLITPASEAIAQEVDERLGTAIVDASNDSGGGGKVTLVSKANDVFTGSDGARSILSRNNLPLAERYAVVSPEAAGEALQDELFVQADKSGSTTALREGSLGRVFGFDTYESQTFGGSVGSDGVAFHRQAVALVSRTLAKPDGLPSDQYAVAGYKGLGLRVVKAYDINKKQDIYSVDFLIGVEKIRVGGAVELDFGIGS